MTKTEEEALKLSFALSRAETRLNAAKKAARKEMPTPEALRQWFMSLSAYVRAKNERDEFALRHVNQYLKWLEALARLADPTVGPRPGGDEQGSGSGLAITHCGQRRDANYKPAV